MTDPGTTADDGALSSAEAAQRWLRARPPAHRTVLRRVTNGDDSMRRVAGHAPGCDVTPEHLTPRFLPLDLSCSLKRWLEQARDRGHSGLPDHEVIERGHHLASELHRCWGPAVEVLLEPRPGWATRLLEEIGRYGGER